MRGLFEAPSRHYIAPSVLSSVSLASASVADAVDLERLHLQVAAVERAVFRTVVYEIVSAGWISAKGGLGRRLRDDRLLNPPNRTT